jgi:RNA polymerase primary sigma factor
MDIMVKSKRKGERMRKRERALEKAEKVASVLASLPPVPKPKKATIVYDPSDPIRAYLRDIGRTRLLTAPEEVALSRKIQVRTFFWMNIFFRNIYCLRSVC